MTDDELDLVPTEQLIEAVKRRGRHTVVAIQTESSYTIFKGYSGNLHMCLGMLSDLEDFLNNKRRRIVETVDAEDD